MDGFRLHLGDVLAIARAIHFAATSIVAGSLIFRLAVVEPSMRSPAAVAVRKQTHRVAAIGLAVAVASGAVWLLLPARKVKKNVVAP